MSKWIVGLEGVVSFFVGWSILLPAEDSSVVSIVGNTVNIPLGVSVVFIGILLVGIWYKDYMEG